jgi:hypothetical protein
VAEVLVEHFVEARLHYDGARGEEISAFQEKLAGSQANPLYLILEPRTERKLDGRIEGITTVERFRAFLLGALEQRDPEEKVGRLAGPR